MEIGKEVKDALAKAQSGAAHEKAKEDFEVHCAEYIQKVALERKMKVGDLLDAFVGYVASALITVSRNEVECVDSLGRFMVAVCKSINGLSNGKIDIQMERREERRD